MRGADDSANGAVPPDREKAIEAINLKDVPSRATGQAATPAVSATGCRGPPLCGAPRLDESHLAGPRHPEASDRTAPSVGDRIHELDALALELLNGPLDVVARQIELVLPLCRCRVAPRMNRELRRRHESQPAIGRMGRGELQDVAEEGSRCVGIMRENRDDRRRDHPASIGVLCAAEQGLTEDIKCDRIPTLCRRLFESGRQDLNLRPPGPQPDFPLFYELDKWRIAGFS